MSSTYFLDIKNKPIYNRKTVRKTFGGIALGILELLLIAIGLSMDAFAVAICKGLSTRKCTWKKMLIVGAYFGVFQALMPVIGYFVGRQFESLITSFDHWVVFALLTIIGINMIREALGRGEEKPTCNNGDDVDLSVKSMLPLAIATSIDALAVGITFAFLNVQIVPAVTLIGITTFIISVGGFKIGNVFGEKYKKRAEIAGGIILILIGLKVLLQHLGVINF